MIKSKAEIPAELHNDFIREVGEISILGDDKYDKRSDSVKHLLTARSKFEFLMRLYKDVERSEPTLPCRGGASADSKMWTPVTEFK